MSRVALNVGSGVVKMSWRKGGSGSELLVATLDGLVRLVDVRLGKVLADCSGHTEAILDFAQSKYEHGSIAYFSFIRFGPNQMRKKIKHKLFATRCHIISN